MSPGHLSDLERGRREPTPAVLKKLAVALNVPVSVLEKHRYHPQLNTARRRPHGYTMAHRRAGS